MRNFKVIDNFLNTSLFDELLSTWPTDFGPSVRSHKDIYFGDSEWGRMDIRWRRLYESVHSRRFWLPVCDRLDMTIPENFDPLFLEPRNGVMPPTSENFTYARCDIGLGLAGYGVDNGGRGVHIDNPQRIISGLLYFTDQSEIDGGEFDICEADGTLVERIPLAKNRAVISVQNNEAWHKVNPLIKGERRAVYFALSSSQKVWDR
jgi:hypothetical protein